MKPGKQVAGLAIFLGLTSATAWVGGLATDSSVGTWYQEIAKPEWTPPGSVIGAVWGVLYPAMGLAAWLVWRKHPFPFSSKPLWLWAAHLPFNALWSVMFFGLQNPGAALLNLVVLWGMIVATTVLFFRPSKPAGVLMMPYAIWVAFAGILNYSIWRMNP